MRSLGVMPFGPLTPDQPVFDSPSASIADNVLPVARGYHPLRAMLAVSDEITDRCLGAISVRTDAGDSYNYCGDGSTLYTLQSSSWVDASKAGGYSGLASMWDFAEYDDRLIATSFSDDPQIITIGSAQFADLTTEFRSRTVATVRNFVAHGNTWDAVDGFKPFRVRWSARGDPTDYAPSSATLSGFRDLDGNAGSIRKIVSGEYALIFQERSITRMSYRGDESVWQFDVVEPEIGTYAPGSVVRWGYDTYFLSPDGFRVFRGASSQPIGEEQIDRSVLADLDDSYLDRVTAAVDPAQQLIYWAYPGAGSIKGICNRLVIYNPAVGKWTTGSDESIAILYQYGPSFVDLDTDLGPWDVPLDIDGSLDDKIWQGGPYRIAAIESSAGGFNRLNTLSTFDGAPRRVRLGVSEFQAQPGHKAMLRFVRPVIDGGVASVRIGHRDRQSDPITWTDWIPQDNEGLCKFRVRARYMRAWAELTGEWQDAVGLDPTVRVAGRR